MSLRTSLCELPERLPMIDRFARHPTAANLLMVVFIVAGVLSLPSLRRETFPDFAPSEVEIRIPYRGATAEQVEEVVCQRVEDALDGVRFVDELRCDARENLATITVEMEDDGDVATFVRDITTEVDAIDDFPSGVEDPVIQELGQTDVVLVLLVAGPMSAGDLKIYCEQLKDRLQQLPEVSLVKMEGFSDRQLRVELSSEMLRRFELTAAEVADVLSRQSLDVPAGLIETRDDDILLRFVEERRSVSELEDVVITAAEGGAEVRLRQLGRVIDTFEDAEQQILLGGHRAGLLRIEKTKNQDVIRVADAVRSHIAIERQRFPQVSIAVTQDASVQVRQRLQMLIKNGWQGMLLVFFSMWVFFNLRLAFWVVMSLPVSFLGAFFFLPPLDLTINMMTMVAMLLALGLLMDDGIVVAENIARHLSAGSSAMRAAIDGVSEVASGVISSFLTTACVLGPLISLDGAIGKVLYVIPIILIVVMSISLIEVFLILPAHLGHSLRHVSTSQTSRFRNRVENVINALQERVVGLAVDRVIEWRYLFAGSVIAAFLFAISLLQGGIVGFQAFPELEGDVLVSRVLLPQGTPLTRTEELVWQMTDALQNVSEKHSPHQPDQQPLVQTVNVQFNVNQDAFENGPHVATITVDLLSSELRTLVIDDIIAQWREAVGDVPDVLSLTYGEPVFGPAGRPIEVRCQGEDIEQLKLAVSKLHAWFGQFQGVSNLTDDLRPGRQEIRVRLKEGAVGLGLTTSSMASQLQTAFRGSTANEIQVGSEAYEVDVQLRAADQDSLADLDDFHFVLQDGAQVPLSAVATLETTRGWARIARIDGRRTVTLIGDVDSRVTNTARIMQQAQSDILPKLIDEFPGVDVSIEGESDEAGQTQLSMVKGMLIGLIGIYVLLSFQFESWLEPAIVMVAIPLALIGVIGGHLLLGLNVCMPSLLGFASLAGVVVNDSILLVLFLKQQRQSGAGMEQSASHASRLRFRAILLTSVTTIAGLTPLLFESSLQAQILIPLAVSIVFGLLASTVLVLLVVPALYVILGDFGLLAPIKCSDSGTVD